MGAAQPYPVLFKEYYEPYIIASKKCYANTGAGWMYKGRGVRGGWMGAAQPYQDLFQEYCALYIIASKRRCVQPSKENDIAGARGRDTGGGGAIYFGSTTHHRLQEWYEDTEGGGGDTRGGGRDTGGREGSLFQKCYEPWAPTLLSSPTLGCRAMTNVFAA
jgi:hypothetical protein